MARGCVRAREETGRGQQSMTALSLRGSRPPGTGKRRRDALSYTGRALHSRCNGGRAQGIPARVNMDNMIPAGCTRSRRSV